MLKTHLEDNTDARSYFRGKNIIDGVWSSPAVAEHVKSLGIAHFYYLIPTDHRGLYLDLDVNNLLDEFNPNFVPPPLPEIKMHNPEASR